MHNSNIQWEVLRGITQLHSTGRECRNVLEDILLGASFEPVAIAFFISTTSSSWLCLLDGGPEDDMVIPQYYATAGEKGLGDNKRYQKLSRFDDVNLGMNGPQNASYRPRIRVVTGKSQRSGSQSCMSTRPWRGF